MPHDSFTGGPGIGTWPRVPSGPGVARPDELFRPFQAGAQSIGLGLYISRAILRAHGGGLRYSPEAAGSCFTVELWPVENQVEG